MLVVEFTYAMKVEIYATRNFKNEIKAYYIALAGINLALVEIQDNFNIVYLDGNGQLIFAKKENGLLKPIEHKRSISLSDGNISYTISDEKGRLNINTATREMIVNLFNEAGSQSPENDIIADSILDWRDANHEFHLNGAEDDYYTMLPQPYEAKDAFFDTPEELLLIKGMTPYIFYGRDDLPVEYSAVSYSSNVFDKEYIGIKRYITVKGDGKINLNTADEKVLEAALGKGRAMEVMLRRKTEGFLEQPVFGGVVSSNIFLIVSKGEIDGIEVKIKAIVEGKPDMLHAKISYWQEG